MSPSELRIGNWYNSIRFNTPIRLHLSDFAEANAHADGSDSLEWFNTHIEPIPLTKKWLLKFGFVKDKETGYRYFLGDSIAYDLDDHGIRISDSWEWNTVKFVHQLQNLYFCLSGEELKTNNNE